MTEYINIGSSPYEEDCAQVGSENYREQARKECKAFLQQCLRELKQEFGEIKTTLRVKSFPHDFGTYHEVVAYFDEADSTEQAFWLESNGPAEWDDTARQELSL
jgi:hypothetical protein